MFTGRNGPGCNDLYERVILPIETGKSLYEAYIYISDHNPALCKTLIESADWTEYSIS